MYKRILDEILKYSTIIIHRHSNPDGDAIGSQAGLGLWLKHHFPEKQVFLVGDGPGRYSFVPSSSIDQIGDEQYQGALAILLDTATPKLISDDRYRLAEKTIRFDHHLYVETFTDLECVDPSFES
ncbi:MAG: DHH family phosphoesterase, partial [Clostridia bacterium]|nr:DHH family phosphoesterase [Clostridia bacterium]